MFFVKERIADKEIPTLRSKWVKHGARNDATLYAGMLIKERVNSL